MIPDDEKHADDAEVENNENNEKRASSAFPNMMMNGIAP
jgi:hypothetical protein